MSDRRLVHLTGTQALPFLQGLVTNDVLPLSRGPGLVYAALLTPQGKYLADFFVGNTGALLLLDLAEPQADAVLQRLAMYRLRADVGFQPLAGMTLRRGLGAPPDGAFADPRHPGLGWRHYGPAEDPAAPPGLTDPADWTARRIALGVPEAGIDLIPNDSYILEMGFERLHGVDFRKGCYVGQEVTARMKHKTELRKGLARLQLEAPVPTGTEILSNGKVIGQVLSTAGREALAYLRLDQAGPDMTAAGQPARICPPG